MTLAHTHANGRRGIVQPGKQGSRYGQNRTPSGTIGQAGKAEPTGGNGDVSPPTTVLWLTGVLGRQPLPQALSASFSAISALSVAF
jgi:hypothetical protein